MKSQVGYYFFTYKLKCDVGLPNQAIGAFVCAISLTVIGLVFQNDARPEIKKHHFTFKGIYISKSSINVDNLFDAFCSFKLFKKCIRWYYSLNYFY